MNGTPIAGAKSCQFQISQDFLTACAPTASRTKQKIPTTYDWSMSVDCLLPNSNLSVDLTDKLIAGTLVLLTFTDKSGNNRAGYAYVKSCSESGSVGSLATFTASFEATGPLYKYLELNNWENTDECDGWELSNYNNSLKYIWEQQGQQVEVSCWVNGFTLPENGKLILYTNDVWGLYNVGLNTVLTWLDALNYNSLQNSYTAWGDGMKTVDVSAGTYTIVNNNKHKILYLYE